MSRTSDLTDELWRLAARFGIADVVGHTGVIVVRMGLVRSGMALSGIADDLAAQAQAAADNLPRSAVVDLHARLAEISAAEAELSRQAEERP
jgi:hypothetical protein